MAQDQLGYVAYLLRLWQAKTNGETGWRPSLEQVDTGERVGFIHLVDLLQYLEQLCVPSPNED